MLESSDKRTTHADYAFAIGHRFSAQLSSARLGWPQTTSDKEIGLFVFAKTWLKLLGLWYLLYLVTNNIFSRLLAVVVVVTCSKKRSD